MLDQPFERPIFHTIIDIESILECTGKLEHKCSVKEDGIVVVLKEWYY